MFDRGLVSVDDNHTLLVAKDRVPEAARRLFLPGGHILGPTRVDWRPHPQFLHYHREHVFKG